MRMIENDLPRIVGHLAMVSVDDRGIWSTDLHMDLRGKSQNIALSRILRAHSPSPGLRRAELDAGVGESVACVLVEDQIAGLQVNSVLNVLWRGLIGARAALGIGDKIDLNFAPGGYFSAFRVIAEVIPINLIVAGRIAAIEDDADLVQFGSAIELELFYIRGFDGKQRALAVGFRDPETIGRFADVNSELVRYFFAEVSRAHAGIKIHPSDSDCDDQGSRDKDSAQTVDWERHLGSV